jgi:erythronate-4-phosphate dehydrogenase
MKIVADENLAYPMELFSQFGDVELFSGRNITNSVLKNADALIIRSVTEVNESLLRGTKISFVGTATIGTDHIDVEFLRYNGIAFASAPGCNSYAVAEYVIASLLFISAENNWPLKDKTIGVVGVGNVGSKVVSFCEALGMKVLKCDPPLYRQGKLTDYVPLNQILDSDIITLHVPLTFESEDRTFHLLDEKKLSSIKNNTILINTSRGAVIDNNSLIKLIYDKKFKVILDVWENEPDISEMLVNQVVIGTPHIAGYTIEGKVNGTIMVCEALSDFLGKKRSIFVKLPEINSKEKHFNLSGYSEKNLHEIIKHIYNIESDHKKLIGINALPHNHRGNYFDKLRKGYPLRREFNNYCIKLHNPGTEIKKLLKALRFDVST